MQCKFTVNGQRFMGDSEEVIEALRDVRPERVQAHGVRIGGTLYPVNQAFAIAFGLARADFVSQTARRVFRKLGFPITGPEPGPTGEAARLRRKRSPEIGPEEEEVLHIPGIYLGWSRWELWEDLAKTLPRGLGIELPRGKPGVYEARLVGEEERLVIGKATDLARRIKDGLLRGYIAHPAGRKIRTHEQIRLVQVRWAITEYPAAAEEVLHQRHVKTFGRMPKYTGHT